MIVNDIQDLPSGALDADVCIIGAGAAGITVACELDGSGLRVVLVDAGNYASVRAASDDHTGFTEPPHPPAHEYRRIGFGGTTAAWGGRCVPLDPIDFEKRPYVPDSGWPISHDDVARYYPAATRYVDAGRFEFDRRDALGDVLATIPGLERQADVLVDRIERYSLPTHYGERYGERLTASDNVTVVLNTRCVGVHREAGTDRIDHALFRDQRDQPRTLRAQVFVMAVGGIETVRLLKVSDREGDGLGNGHDQLGRYYNCHFDSLCAKLIVPRSVRIPFEFERSHDGVYCRRKLQFSADAQRAHQLLNMSFRLHFPNYSDATHGSAVLSTIYLAKSILIPEYRKLLHAAAGEVIESPLWMHWRNVFSNVPELFRFGHTWLLKQKLAQRRLPYTLIRNADGSFPFEFNSEQIPLAHSRVTLAAGSTDRHGLPKVRIDWQMCEEDFDSAIRGFALLRDAIHDNTQCQLVYDEEDLRHQLHQCIPVGGHHLGTARMSSSPRTGVVDEQCAVHGVPNLFVASSAVFPTCGHANPTLTIVAMAIRLSEHLRQTMARPPLS